MVTLEFRMRLEREGYRVSLVSSAARNTGHRGETDLNEHAIVAPGSRFKNEIGEIEHQAVLPRGLIQG